MRAKTTAAGARSGERGKCRVVVRANVLSVRLHDVMTTTVSIVHIRRPATTVFQARLLGLSQFNSHNQSEHGL